MTIIEKFKNGSRKLCRTIEKKTLETGFTEIVYHGIAIVIITGVLTFILVKLEIVPHLSFFHEILIAIGIFVILILLWIGVAFVLHRKPLFHLFMIEKTPLKGYFRGEIQRFFDETAAKITTTDGVEMTQANVNMLTEALFKSGDGVYIGIESNLPSAYFDIYPIYLEHHAAYLKRLFDAKKIAEGKRILIAKDIGEIYNDSILNTAQYAKFIDWHEDPEHTTELFWIEKSKAEELRKQHNLKTTDIGFWKDTFAVFFERADKEKYSVSMTLKGTTLFKTVDQYIKDIIRGAHSVEIEIPIVQKELVDAWEGYVGCNKRLEAIKAFLTDWLDDYKGYSGRILDAAPGIGCEAIFLLKNGFDVSVNEADPGFNNLLTEKIKREVGQKVEVHQYDWRKLSENLGHLYSVILVLGNSLCMMRGKSHRKKSIAEFYSLLKPGGKIIIDERNFSDILNKRDKYKSKKSMYMGDVVDFRLTFENKSLIRFRFFYIANPEKEIGSIVVEAIEKGEIKEVLKTTGFENIDVYSDFEKGYKEDVEFYTYVATKPELKNEKTSA